MRINIQVTRRTQRNLWLIAEGMFYLTLLMFVFVLVQVVGMGPQ